MECSFLGRRRVWWWLVVWIAATTATTATTYLDNDILFDDLFFETEENETCEASKIACWDGVCVPHSWVCDGVDDCSDGEDEHDCSVDCLSYEVACSSRGCVDKNKWCDGQLDCEDGSDEMHCNRTRTCPPDQYRCNNSECIDLHLRCDGELDCLDRSDELNCESFTCPADQFRCGNSTICIPNTWRCDGSKDCPDGWDEDCDPAILTCQSFLCKDRSRCLEAELVCDGQVDCQDASDEANNCSVSCGPLSCSYACFPSDDGVECVCPTGYTASPHTPSQCQDIDECDGGKFGEEPACSQKCINMEGSFRCVCADLYSLEPDAHTCRMRHPAPILVMSSPSNIYTFNLRQQGQRIDVVEQGLNSVEDIDVDSSKLKIYWIDSQDRKIYTSDLNHIGQSYNPVFLNVGLVRPKSLSYNWHRDQLYVLDAHQGVIVVCGDDGTVCALVVDGLKNRNPGDILVDPVSRHLYWTENAHPTCIMRSALDGGERQVFVQVHMIDLQHLTLDLPSQHLYWVDTASHTIHRLPLNLHPDDRAGSIQTLSIRGVHHPTGLVIVEDRVIWSEKKTGNVIGASKWTGKGRRGIVKHNHGVNGLAVLHSALQPNAGDNACLRAHCDTLCVESKTGRGFRCLCPPGMILMSDQQTCVWIHTTPYLLLATTDKIMQIPPSNIGHVSVRELPAPGLDAGSVLDLNPVTQEVVFSKWTNNAIYGKRAVVIKSNNIWNVNLAYSVIEERPDYLGQPLSLAVDWLANQTFWLNGERNTIEIFQNSGRGHSRLSFHGVGSIKVIAIDVMKGLLFYGTWGDQAGITRCSMDGRDCTVIVTRRIRQPYRLVSSQGRLYWSDHRLGHISSISHDGTDRKTHVHMSSPQEFAVYTNLYYHDNVTESVHLFDMNDGVSLADYEFPDVSVHDMAMLIPQTVPDLPCTRDNGGCSDICVSLPAKQRRCLCPPQKTLSDDQQTCKERTQACLADEVFCKSSEACVKKQDLCNGQAHCAEITGLVECVDDEACSADNECQQLCVRSGKSHVCSCYHGYYLTSDGRSCADVDECDFRNGNCSQLCFNTKGRYSCDCINGYILIGDRATCHSKDHDSAFLVVSTMEGFIRVEMDGQSERRIMYGRIQPASFDLALSNDWKTWGSLQVNVRLLKRLNFKTSLLWVGGEKSQDGPSIDLQDSHVRQIWSARQQLRVVRVDQVTWNVYIVAQEGDAFSLIVCHRALYHCHIIQDGEDWQPTSLVLHSVRRKMYYVNKKDRTISTAFMDGQGERSLVNNVDSIPDGLTLCPLRERFYWIEPLAPTGSAIQTSKTDGSDRYTLVSLPRLQLLSVDMFEGYLYMTEGSKSVVKISTFSSRPVIANMRRVDTYGIGDVRVIRSPPNISDPCAGMPCKYMCVLSETGGRCLCPHDVLQSSVSMDCIHDGYLPTTPTPLTTRHPTPRPQTLPPPPRPLPPSPRLPKSKGKEAWINNRPFSAKSTSTKASIAVTSTASPSNEPWSYQCSNYCLNVAFCTVVNGKPVCRCSHEFTGERCELRMRPDNIIPSNTNNVNDPNIIADRSNTSNVNSTQPSSSSGGMGEGGVTAVVVVVILIVIGASLVAFWVYRKKWSSHRGYMGAEYRNESDEACLVPGDGQCDA